MSLLNDAMEKCVMLHKITSDDELGGEGERWVGGASFEAAISFANSIQARIAGAQGVRNLYTVSVRKSKMLGYHDVFLREADGKVFRVTSDGYDSKTPNSAALNMRVVSAEEWSPNGPINTGGDVNG